MASKAEITELVGKDLKGFKIVEMTEVFRTDNDGRRDKSLGYFKDNNVAVAFAGVQTDAMWHKTEKLFVLTDGTVGYVIAHEEPVKLIDDEVEAVEIKKKALAKLSAAERKLLGYE